MIFDHVEILVPDRDQAAAWYEKVLGFKVLEQHLDWAESGPLMISNDDGGQMIALFTGEPQGDHRICGLRRLAFRVSGPDFAEFIENSHSWSEPPLGRGDIQDHEKAMSVYFTDPFGTPLEVTTYDYELARKFVKSLSG